MPIELVSPAPLLDLLELYAATGAAKPMHRKMLMLAWSRAPSFGFVERGDLLAAVVLWPESATQSELMFCCRPAIVRRLCALIHGSRTIRRTLPDTARLRAVVRTPAGARLARLVGMVPLPIVGPHGVYELTGPHDAIRARAEIVVRGKQRQR